MRGWARRPRDGNRARRGEGQGASSCGVLRQMSCPPHVCFDIPSYRRLRLLTWWLATCVGSDSAASTRVRDRYRASCRSSGVWRSVMWGVVISLMTRRAWGAITWSGIPSHRGKGFIECESQSLAICNWDPWENWRQDNTAVNEPHIIARWASGPQCSQENLRLKNAVRAWIPLDPRQEGSAIKEANRGSKAIPLSAAAPR